MFIVLTFAWLLNWLLWLLCTLLDMHCCGLYWCTIALFNCVGWCLIFYLEPWLRLEIMLLKSCYAIMWSLAHGIGYGFWMTLWSLLGMVWTWLKNAPLCSFFCNIWIVHCNVKTCILLVWNKLEFECNFEVIWKCMWWTWSCNENWFEWSLKFEKKHDDLMKKDWKLMIVVWNVNMILTGKNGQKQGKGPRFKSWFVTWSDQEMDLEMDQVP